MPNFLTTTLVFVKEEVDNFFIQPLFVGDSALSRFFIRRNVKSSYAIQKFGSATKLTKVFAGGFQGNTGSTVTQRTVTVARAKAEASQQADEFMNTIVGDWLALGNDKDDLSKSERLRELISGIMLKGVQRDLARQIWFNDSAGAFGVNYNFYDGVFKNYESLPALQMIVGPIGALAVDAAITEFQKVIDAMPLEFKEFKDQAVMEISGSYADNYRATLRATGTEQADVMLKEGMSALMYDGIKIIVHRQWDSDIAADALATNPHRIVLHLEENVEVGTDLDADQDAKFWYNIDENENRWRLTYVLGTNYRNEEFAVTSISA